MESGFLAFPIVFEPPACRLGGDRSILLSYGTSFSNVHILQGFRGFGDCSPWCLGVVFANQEGRFLIGFSNFGGRIFSHLLILTLWIRGVGLIPFLGHFRTLRPFSVSGKAVVGLLLRRRSLYPAELRRHAHGLSATATLYYRTRRRNCQPFWSKNTVRQCRTTIHLGHREKKIEGYGYFCYS